MGSRPRLHSGGCVSITDVCKTPQIFPKNVSFHLSWCNLGSFYCNQETWLLITWDLLKRYWDSSQRAQEMWERQGAGALWPSHKVSTSCSGTWLWLLPLACVSIGTSCAQGGDSDGPSWATVHSCSRRGEEGCWLTKAEATRYLDLILFPQSFPHFNVLIACLGKESFFLFFLMYYIKEYILTINECRKNTNYPTMNKINTNIIMR